MMISTYYAGVKFRAGAADIIAEMPNGTELELRPEPDNKFDPNAIAVLYSDAQLGYVPGHLCEKILGYIDAGQINMVMHGEGNKFEIHHSGGEENDV